MQAFFLILVSVLNLLAGIFVFFSGPRQDTNRHYLYLAFSVWGWSFGLGVFYYSDNIALTSLAISFFYLSAIAISHAALMLALEFTGKLTFILKVFLAVSFIVFAFAILKVDGFLISRSWIEAGRPYYGINKTGYFLYGSAFFVQYLAAVYFIYKKWKKSRDYIKQQALYLLTALVIGAVFGVYFNLILPWYGNFDLIYVGPLFSIVFLIIVGYGISKAKLFNLSAALARATAYSLTLLVMIFIYGGTIFIISEKITKYISLSLSAERFTFIVFAIFTAVIFQPLRKFFDRVTNFIFYQDAYDTGEFLGELNKQLAMATNLDSFLVPTAKIIQKHLKNEYVVFGIKESHGVERRVVGTAKKTYPEEDIVQLREATIALPRQIISLDELINSQELTHEEKTVKRLMKKYNIAIVARLTDRPNSHEEGAGYLVMGNKKSGNSYSTNDVQVLEIVVNSLVLGIQNALRFEEIENFNETLQEKIYIATKELKHSNEKLKALDEAKDEFISMASHQLRTPLTSIKGYLSMLSEGDAGKLNDTQKKFIDQSFVSAQRMVYLISDLLNVSRLKTGKFVIERVPTYLPSVIEQEIAQLYETAGSKGIEFTYNKPDEFPTLSLDETKIRQVVMNFCDNAIYYTPEGGKVSLDLKADKKKIEFTVTDTGLGVPKAEQHKLFTKFYRAGNARKVRPDGTGLGLFMAKKVISAQGGAIIFKSVEGKGSTFGFSFPINHLSFIEPNTTDKA